MLPAGDLEALAVAEQVHARARHAATDDREAQRDGVVRGERGQQLVVFAIVQKGSAPNPSLRAWSGRRSTAISSAQPDCAAMRAASLAIPSERSITAWATGASDRPASRRNGGRVCARTSSSYPASPSSSARRPAAAPPSGPVTTRTSPAGARATRHAVAATDRRDGQVDVVSRRRVAAPDRHPRLGEPLVQLEDGVDVGVGSYAQGDEERFRLRARGGQVAQVDCGGLVTEVVPGGPLEPEVDSLHEHVLGDDHASVEDGRVVPDALGKPAPGQLGQEAELTEIQSLDPKDVHRLVADAEVAEADPSPAVRARARDREKAWYHGTARLPSAR